MRERKVRKNLRRQRAHAIREGRAVSPVVATLILILVAVAAAAALYLWLVAWQGNITGSIGTPTAQSTMTIGGSTSVYPFDQVAVQQFEQNNSNIVISNNQGGTGAGMLAVCHGAVDIGASSSLQTLAGLETNDQCPATTVINTVAYDAVDVILPVANPHGIVSINESVLLGLYLTASTTTPTTAMPAYLAASGWIAGTPVAWQDVPTTANCLTAGQLLPPGGAGTGCTLVSDANKAHPVQTAERSDTSGTEQTFTAKLLGIAGTNPVTTYSGLAGNFGGCGSDGQLASCGITATFQGNGNPAVIQSVASHPDAIGFASDGLARASSSGVTCQGVATGPCGIAYAGVGQTSAVQPSLGSSGTIAKAILDPSGTGSVALTGEYSGWRPFEWVTTNTPTGEVQRLLQYVLDPANNIAFAAESAEISVYSV